MTHRDPSIDAPLGSVVVPRPGAYPATEQQRGRALCAACDRQPDVEVRQVVYGCERTSPVEAERTVEAHSGVTDIARKAKSGLKGNSILGEGDPEVGAGRRPLRLKARDEQGEQEYGPKAQSQWVSSEYQEG